MGGDASVRVKNQIAQEARRHRHNPKADADSVERDGAKYDQGLLVSRLASGPASAGPIERADSLSL